MNISKYVTTLILIIIFLSLTGCNELFKGKSEASPVVQSQDNLVEETGEDQFVEISAQGQELAGIKISEIETGNIYKSKEFAGKIVINDEKMSKITPRYSGFVTKISKKIGEYVNIGDILVEIENRETFTKYIVKSDAAGQIIERNANKGDYASDDEPIFVIADFTNLWIDIQVFPKDADIVKIGKKIIIEEIGTSKTAEAKIFFISPISDPETGSTTARALLENKNLKWKVGTFIKSSFLHKAAKDVIVVKNSSIQFMDGNPILFIPEGDNKFKPVEIKTGASNKMFSEILSGLDKGSKYVSRGGFELKSKIAVGSLGEHAGCGGSH